VNPAPILTDAGVELRADPSRVVAKLFLPGDGPTRARARTVEIIERVLALPPDAVRQGADAILRDFGARHDDFLDLLNRHADAVASSELEHQRPDITRDQSIVIGAAFTMEYAVEGAALCNPSAVVHPDQSGLAQGELRVAVALRAIGEGHVSSIAFASAVIGVDGWVFDAREAPLSRAEISEGDWSREHFLDALEQETRINELAAAILRSLPDDFRSGQIEQAIRELPLDLVQRRNSSGELELVRAMAWSAYRADFASSTDLTQRVLLPFSAEESHGMEDARFVLFQDGDQAPEYRATYTAYDGNTIAPRLIASPDLRRFGIHRLSGPAAANKGMALFPRRIGNAMLALTRTDGENLTLARSTDGLEWAGQATVHVPKKLWELIQTGNCGAPIETNQGWLVLIHGVGPMRAYSIGALLLDLLDPTRVIGELSEPLLRPAGDLRDGYVPNVVYSCGAIVHDGTLWLPYGVGDARIRVASIGLTELLGAMTTIPH
jgi:predicted GH43/DUF377 family glycosyl hydrolase